MYQTAIDRFFSKVEWRWSLANMLWGVGAIASATLPAWAVRTMELFSEFSPLSWVLAGFAGLAVYCLCYLFFAWARTIHVRSRFNDRIMNSGGFVDPMAKVFERKRIFLNDFCLPTNPYITDKSFIDCEIIGPANLFLAVKNRVDQIQLPDCDAVVLPPDGKFYNGYTLINSTFRRCSFHRVTFFVSQAEYESVKDLGWLNWISYAPDSDLPLLAKPDQNAETERQSQPDTEEETRL